MSDEVEVDTRQIYLIPADGNDGIQSTEVNKLDTFCNIFRNSSYVSFINLGQKLWL